MNRQIFEYHPIFGYKFIADLKARIPHEAGGYLLKTNSDGFRSEFDFSKEKGRNKRILVFGDSFTAGDGVSNKFRFTDVLQTMLPNTEIYNFGLPGSGTDQQYLIYQEYAYNFKCDLVIIVVLVENIRRVMSKYRYFYNEANEKLIYQKPYFELLNHTLVLKNVPVPATALRPEDLKDEEMEKVDTGGRLEFARNIINSLGLKEITQRYTKYQPLPEYEIRNSKPWELMSKILTSWVSVIPSKVLIVPLPLYQYIEETSDPSGYQKRFKDLETQLNIPILDPLSSLQKYTIPERRNFRFTNDVHPTASGHRAIAECIYEKVLSML